MQKSFQLRTALYLHIIIVIYKFGGEEYRVKFTTWVVKSTTTFEIYPQSTYTLGKVGLIQS